MALIDSMKATDFDFALSESTVSLERSLVLSYSDQAYIEVRLCINWIVVRFRCLEWLESDRRQFYANGTISLSSMSYHLRISFVSQYMRLPRKDDKKRQKTKPFGLVCFVLHVLFAVLYRLSLPCDLRKR